MAFNPIVDRAGKAEKFWPSFSSAFRYLFNEDIHMSRMRTPLPGVEIAPSTAADEQIEFRYLGQSGKQAYGAFIQELRSLHDKDHRDDRWMEWPEDFGQLSADVVAKMHHLRNRMAEDIITDATGDFSFCKDHQLEDAIHRLRAIFPDTDPLIVSDGRLEFRDRLIERIQSEFHRRKSKVA